MIPTLRAGLLALFWAAPVWAGACYDISDEDRSYTVCETAAGDDLRLWLNGADGAPYGSFARVEAALKPGERLVFAMNAGMYHSDRRAVGLYSENGLEIAPLVKRAGPGNFGMLPNGVFCIGDGRFAVVETLAFAADARSCHYASQSGPMLVIDGALHPRFLVDASSRNIRNGVGVSADGQRAYLAISNDGVTFHEFARLFRDVLRTPNALYFDGRISRLYAPDLGRDDGGFPMGPIVGLVAPAP